MIVFDVFMCEMSMEAWRWMLGGYHVDVGIFSVLCTSANRDVHLARQRAGPLRHPATK